MRVEIGCFIEGLFFLKLDEEASYLHKTFFTLYNNRMTMVHKQTQSKIELIRKSESESMFKPSLNKKSIEITESHGRRGKIEENLLKKGAEYQERIDGEIRKKAQIEDKEQNFQPQIV